MEKEKGFVNPYNFIAFPPKKAKAYTDEDRHTGYISYTITTKTPLFIPNSSSDTAFNESGAVKDQDRKKDQYHKSYDFFSYTKLDSQKHYENEYHEPVIPGSEMRGVVRSVYETLTDSCMGMLNEDEYPVKRSGERFNPALIHRNASGKLELCDADSLAIGIGEDAHWGTTKSGKKQLRATKPPIGFKKCKNGSLISYQQPEKNKAGRLGEKKIYDFQGNKYEKQGYLFKWGMGVTKLHYHVFTLKTGNNVVKNITISKDVVERKLFPVIESYLAQTKIEEHNKKAYEDYKSDLEDFLQEKGEAYFPVMYSRVGEKGTYFLAPASFSKEVSTHKIEALTDFLPCKTECCPACDLFGRVGEDISTTKSSSIRFTDLYVARKMEAREYYDKDKITIEALGGPKLGNVDFYLERPKGATFWTYDYYIQNGTLQEYNGVLRGRKYYWHHTKFDYRETEATILNKTIRPVKAGICFEGKLYFEGISNRQLNQLIWILNSGKEALGLKLGAAKPLGYGSIKCHVASVTERKITLADGVVKYEMEPVNFKNVTYENAGLSTSGRVKDEFYKIAGLNTIPEDIPITYPRTEAPKEKKDWVMKEGYRWFVNNHAGFAKRRTEASINKALPHIMDEDITLPYDVRTEKK